MRRDLHPAVYPLLPDYDGTTVSPAPDGHPWRKACPECLFRTSNPQDAPSAYLDRFWESQGETVFYCIHRTDGEQHRVCACFAAHNAGAALSQPTPTTEDKGREDRA